MFGTTPKKRTKTQEQHLRRLYDALLELRMDFQHPELVPGLIPPEWCTLTMDTVCEKTRMTIRLDKDVAKFYRGFGPGFQSKMNLVLRAYMLGYLSDTMGRVETDVDPIDWSDLSDDEQLDLNTELSYINLIKELRQNRLRALARD